MKKKRIIVISIILIIIVIVAAIAILYFTTDLFKSREQLFWKYFSQSIDLTEMISNDKYILQSNFKQNNSYTGSGIISFVKEQGENSSKQYLIISMVEDVKGRGGSHYLLPKVKSIFQKII